MTLAAGVLPGYAQTSPAVVAPPGLNLTPAQQARAQARQQQFGKDMNALQTNNILTPTQKAVKAKALEKALDTDMLAILTPQQRSQVMAQRQAVAQKRQSFMKAHQAQITQGRVLAAKLNKSLTPAQKTQIDGLKRQLAAQGQALSTNSSLTPAAKQQKWTSEQKQAQTKMLAVLTPTQKADYEKMLQIQKQILAAAQTGK